MVVLRNVLLQNVARTLGDDVSSDLPVNPLLCILYTLRFEQLAASDTADKIAGLADILAAVSRIEVLFRGSAVLSGSLTDVMVLNSLYMGRLPFIIHGGDAADRALAVTVPLWLGRPRMKGAEAFPPVRRGELTLHRVFASSVSRIVTTTITEQVETVEVLDASPGAFLKAVTLSKTFATSGDNDVDLPLGNPLLGALLYGTTGFAATTSAATWKQVKLLVDNVEYMYALSNWETLHGDLNRRLALMGDYQSHTHVENLAAAYAADATTGKVEASEGLLANYAWLDFDPFDDDSQLIDTSGRGRVHLRATAGTADAARCMPLELVKIEAQSAG